MKRVLQLVLFGAVLASAPRLVAAQDVPEESPLIVSIGSWTDNDKPLLSCKALQEPQVDSTNGYISQATTSATGTSSEMTVVNLLADTSLEPLNLDSIQFALAAVGEGCSDNADYNVFLGGELLLSGSISALSKCAQTPELSLFAKTTGSGDLKVIVKPKGTSSNCMYRVQGRFMTHTMNELPMMVPDLPVEVPMELHDEPPKVQQGTIVSVKGSGLSKGKIVQSTFNSGSDGEETAHPGEPDVVPAPITPSLSTAEMVSFADFAGNQQFMGQEVYITDSAKLTDGEPKPSNDSAFSPEGDSAATGSSSQADHVDSDQHAGANGLKVPFIALSVGTLVASLTFLF